MTEQTAPKTPAARIPRPEYRLRGLEHAVDLAKAHTGLSYPGAAALLWAGKFAQFLEDGTNETETEDDK